MAAAEAHAESPAPVAPPLPLPEKRAAPENGTDHDDAQPWTKRRRASVAALDGVPCATAAAEEEDGRRDGSSFSFQQASGGFVALETTPKFGSFNPPAAAEPEQQEALDPKPAPCAAGDSAEAEEEEEEDAVSPDREDGNSQFVAAPASGQGEPERENESE